VGHDPHADETRWSRIQALGSPERAREWREAWEHLERTYRPALVAYAGALLARAGRAVGRDEAEDLVQSFLASCVEKDWLARAAPEFGRFRAFVRVLLKRYARAWIAARVAAKRMPPAGPPLSLDAAASDPADAPDDAEEALLAAEWAGCQLAVALARVRARSDQNALLLEQSMRTPGATPTELADRLGLPAQRANVILFRARRMLAEALWSEVKETVTDPTDRDEERAALRPFLAPYLDEKSAPSFFGP
jgi:DNA-directed RNA polymerase specialized sigma24 family protein